MRKYFYYVVYERNGNYEYKHKGTTSFDEKDLESTTPQEWLEEHARTFYSEGEAEEVGGRTYYWHFGELVTRADLIKETPKETYDLLNSLNLLS